MGYPDGRVLKKVQVASRGAGAVDLHRATGRSADVEGERDQSEQHRARRKEKSTSKPVDKWVAKKPVPSLPNEMWDKILSHCDPSSLAAVCGVCKSMRRSALPHRTAFRIDAAKLDQGQILDTLMHIRVNFPHLTSVSLVNGNLRGFTFYASDEHSRFTLFPENLRHLSMENSEGLDDDQVKALCAELPRLRHMDLSKCFELSNQILRYLPTTLTILNLCGVHDINANALRLLPHLKNLEILDLKACWRLGSLYSQQNPFTSSGPYYSYFPSSPSIATYSAFAYLQSLPRLHTLSLSRIYCLADNDIAMLPRRLKVLDVSFCFHISDYVYPMLPAGLTELYCQGCDLITFDTWDSASEDGLTILRDEEGSTSSSSSSAEGEDEGPGDGQGNSLEDAKAHSRPEVAWIGRTRSRDGAARTKRPKLRIVRGEWSLPERCCVP